MLQLMSLVPADKEREKLIHNPPHLVFLTSMIERCQGCKKEFSKTDHETPNDLIFKYLMFRQWPNGKGGIDTSDTRSAGYFHAYDLGCLVRYKELQNITTKGVYMPNSTFQSLTPDYIEKLKKSKMWDDIIDTRQKLM